MHLIPVMFWWDHSHTLKHVFHLSVYCFIQPWWLSSICFHNIRPQRISVRGVYSFESSSREWLRKRAVCSHHGCVHTVRLLPRLIVAPVELNRLLLAGLRDSLPPSHTHSHTKTSKRREASENQFLIKLICKGCIRRCSTFALAQLSVWCDLENVTRCLTNSERAWQRWRCCFCLFVDW